MTRPACLEWAVYLACVNAGCTFLSETVKVTCSNGSTARPAVPASNSVQLVSVRRTSNWRISCRCSERVIVSIDNVIYVDKSPVSLAACLFQVYKYWACRLSKSQESGKLGKKAMHFLAKCEADKINSSWATDRRGFLALLDGWLKRH